MLRDIEGIDFNSHYFVLMHPLEKMVIPSFGYIAFVSSESREKWVECEIVENNNRLDDGYKVTLKPLEEGYPSERLYIEDFISHVKKGIIVKKEEDMECVEEEWIEPLTDKAYLHHSAYVLKRKNNK